MRVCEMWGWGYVWCVRVKERGLYMYMRQLDHCLGLHYMCIRCICVLHWLPLEPFLKVGGCG